MKSAHTAEKLYNAKFKDNASDGEPAYKPVLAGMKVPEPVFFCSIEPPSLAYQKKLDTALECLTREDPSLRVHVDENTGETILSGMGQLHLEIIKVEGTITHFYKTDYSMIFTGLSDQFTLQHSH